MAWAWAKGERLLQARGKWLARVVHRLWRLTWEWASFRVGAVAALLRVVAGWAFGKEHRVFLAARKV